jgi:hypothetical protein
MIEDDLSDLAEHDLAALNTIGMQGDGLSPRVPPPVAT